MTLAERICRALGGKWSNGQGNVAGLGHGPRDLSMAVADDGRGGVILYSHAGEDWRPMADKLRAEGLLPPRGRCRAPRPPPASRQPVPARDRTADTARALRLWHEAGDAHGTRAESYLASRALPLPIAADALRWHPACPFGPGERHGCMVALMRHAATGEPLAIHRTAIDARGRKVGRMMLGPAGGAVVMLGGDATAQLGVAEGIETALSVPALGWRAGPIWATGSAGGIRFMPVLPGVKLTIFADPGPVGEAAADALAIRWTAGGSDVEIQTPPGSDDFNDILRKGRA